MGCHFLLQGVLLTQGLNPHLLSLLCLLHCGQILYHLAVQVWCSGKLEQSGSVNWWWRLKKCGGSGRRDLRDCCLTTTTCKEGDGGTGTWATNEKWGELLLASASGLLGFVCISFILRLLPLFLMIISLAPGHSYHLFSYYLHWKPTYLFKR